MRIELLCGKRRGGASSAIGLCTADSRTVGHGISIPCANLLRIGLPSLDELFAELSRVETSRNAPGVVPPSDAIAAWSHATKFALELLAAGRFLPTLEDSEAKAGEPTQRARRERVPWADLVRRVVARRNPALCPCGGQRVVLGMVFDPAAIQRILRHLGLWEEERVGSRGSCVPGPA